MQRNCEEQIEHLKKRDPRIDAIELPYDDDEDLNSEEFYYGEVDHESYGMLEAFLSKNNVSIEDFIFDPRYIVIIDGDEIQKWNIVKETGIIDMSIIEEEFPVLESDRHDTVSYGFYKYMEEKTKGILLEDFSHL